MENKPGVALLAFSGGLDTSYCVLKLLDEGWTVWTVTVDTGGFSAAELAAIEARSARLGAARHVTLDAVERFCAEVAEYLVYGNVVRGRGYPVCVAAERTVQALETVAFARAHGIKTLAHGCTGAGNDQVRFENAFRAAAPEMTVSAPIAAGAVERAASAAALRAAGIAVEEKTSTYSVNRGLLGTTIGGGETHDPLKAIPESAYLLAEAGLEVDGAPPAELEITFTRGKVTALGGKPCDTAQALKTLNAIGAAWGIGRGEHVGTTTLGVKGRIGYSAPGMTILLEAHRRLEDYTLVQEQASLKRALAESYGELLHHGKFMNPVMRDLEAFLASSQSGVSGVVGMRLGAGSAVAATCSSPNNLMNGAVAKYGESHSAWTPEDVAGFRKLHALETVIAAQRKGA